MMNNSVIKDGVSSSPPSTQLVLGAQTDFIEKEENAPSSQTSSQLGLGAKTEERASSSHISSQIELTAEADFIEMEETASTSQTNSQLDLSAEFDFVETEEHTSSSYIGSQLELDAEANCNEHSSLYKYRGRTLEASQEERRAKYLEDQKSKRHILTDKNRQLFNSFIQQSCKNEEQMEVEEALQKQDKKYFPKFVLMRSEWFTEVPDDLEENWLVKCVPHGCRVMIIAQHNKTIIYSTRGRPIRTIKSNFPGGGGGTEKYYNGQTILDGIYSATNNALFILDCLVWNKVLMLDTDSKFRFFWLRSKFDDEPQLQMCKNFTFAYLLDIPASKPLIQDRMSQVFKLNEVEYRYDGITFYHKEAYYILGKTPLLGWLASFMLPEVLNIDVAPEHMVKRPTDYQGVHEYVNQYKNRPAKKKVLKKRRFRKKEKMEVDQQSS